jgi:hypothetical protein
MILSIVVTTYPHLPGVNESGTGISVDEQAYVNWLAEFRELQSEGIATSSYEMILAIFDKGLGDRPLSILFLLVLGDITGFSDATIVRYLPAMLAPAFVVTCYCLVRYGYLTHTKATNSTWNKNTLAYTVPFAAAFCPQIVVGLYAGFLANWLALLTGFLAMLFAIRISEMAGRLDPRGVGRKHLVITTLLFFTTLTVTMLLHIYTWGFFVLALLLFAFYSYFSIRKSGPSKKSEAIRITIVLIAVIAASIIVDIVKSSYFSVTSGLVTDSFLAERSFGLENFNARWETIYFTLGSYVGGYLSHPGIMMLALFWVFRTSNFRGLERLMFSMLFVLAIPMLFGTTLIQARLLYIVPLFIPAVLFIDSIRREKNNIFLFLIPAILLSMVVYALRAMVNLYLVLPEGYEIDTPFLAP